MTTPDVPQAWADLIEALTLLAKHPSDASIPIACEHNELEVNADVAAFTTQQLDRLLDLGFRPNLDGGSFYSFRGTD